MGPPIVAHRSGEDAAEYNGSDSDKVVRLKGGTEATFSEGRVIILSSRFSSVDDEVEPS